MQNKVMLCALGLLMLGQEAIVAPLEAQAAPRKKAAAVKPAQVAALGLPGVRVVEPGRVSLDFVGADIHDVLKALAMQAKINIVAAADVKGDVTVSLSRVTVSEALDMVARLSGFEYAKHGSSYVVGTSKSVADLVGSTVPVALPSSAAIPFIYSDGKSLVDSIKAAFPAVTVSLVSVGADAKAVAEKSDDKEKDAGPKVERTLPKGGVINVLGSADAIEAIRFFVRSTERAIFESSQQEKQTVAEQIAAFESEVYRVKYASLPSLISVLQDLVPTLKVTPGVTQAFQAGGEGASETFKKAPTEMSYGDKGAQASAGTAATTLLLTGSANDLARAKDLLAQIDVRPAQVVFEARVMDIGTNDFSKIGLTYDFGRNVRIGEPGTGGTGGSFDARPLQFGSILRSPYDIGVNLDALAQNGKSRLLASPNISALDGQPAVAFIGDQIKYIISRDVTPTGTEIKTETASIGITLKVTGKVSSDGYITMYCHPEVSVISGYIEGLPQIATRFVDTTVRVKDGETIAIGGLIRETDVASLQKVPLFGDLPFFGQLFRRNEKNRSKSEIVIFITSRVLKD